MDLPAGEHKIVSRADGNNYLTICAITLDIYKQKGSGNVKIGKEFTKGQGGKVAGRLSFSKTSEVFEVCFGRGWV